MWLVLDWWQGLFLTWVVRPELMQIAVWLAWFSVLGFLKVGQAHVIIGISFSVQSFISILVVYNLAWLLRLLFSIYWRSLDVRESTEDAHFSFMTLLLTILLSASERSGITRYFSSYTDICSSQYCNLDLRFIWLYADVSRIGQRSFRTVERITFCNNVLSSEGLRSSSLCSSIWLALVSKLSNSIQLIFLENIMTTDWWCRLD